MRFHRRCGVGNSELGFEFMADSASFTLGYTDSTAWRSWSWGRGCIYSYQWSCRYFLSVGLV